MAANFDWVPGTERVDMSREVRQHKRKTEPREHDPFGPSGPTAVGRQDVSKDKTQAMNPTIPQLEKVTSGLRSKIASKELGEGNVELAALLGDKASQMALGKNQHDGMSPAELIKFLLNDPNLNVQIGVRSSG